MKPKPEGLGAVTASEIPVWPPFNLAEQATSLATRRPPSNDEPWAINALLERRVVEMRAVEEAGKKRHG